MHGRTAAILQGLLWVTATNGASVCMRVYVLCGRTILNTTTWTIPTRTSFELIKHPRSTAVFQQQQQQRYNTSELHILYE